MTPEQTTLQTALRMLGNKAQFSWHAVDRHLHGVMMLSIGLNIDCRELMDIREAAYSLMMNEPTPLEEYISNQNKLAAIDLGGGV